MKITCPHCHASFLLSEVRLPESIKSEYEAGATLMDLAEQYGCQLGLVRYRLAKLGCRFRPNGRPKGYRQEDSSLTNYDVFMKMRAKGATLEEIAKACGCTRQNIGYLAKRLKMDRKSLNAARARVSEGV